MKESDPCPQSKPSRHLPCSPAAVAAAQQTGQVQLKIDPANRTLTVTAENQVTVDPDLAILYVGFQTQPSDAKAAYAAGAKLRTPLLTPLSTPESLDLHSQRVAAARSAYLKPAQVHPVATVDRKSPARACRGDSRYRRHRRGH